MRNLEGLNRSPVWTAWDAKTRYTQASPKVRKALRRVIKHQHKQEKQKEIAKQTQEDRSE